MSEKLLIITGFILFNSIIGSSMVLAQDKQMSIPFGEVSMEKAIRFFRLDGQVEAVNIASVSAQTSGTIKEIYFDVDDMVEQGQLIVRLDDTRLQTQLKQAKAALAEATSQLHRVESEYQRIASVFKQKLASQSQMDNAKADRKAGQARLTAAQANVEQAEEQLSYTRIKAPYSGIVTRQHVQPGEMTQQGQLLMTGLSLDKLRINVNVPQSIVNKIRHYKKAYVEISAENILFIEDITIFPYADPNTASFKVRLTLPELIENLFPGMYVKVAFVIGETEALLVPAQSVVYRSEVVAVYVKNEDGQLEFRYIRVGNPSNQGEKLLVLSGLKAGEKVALDPVAAAVELINQRSGKN